MIQKSSNLINTKELEKLKNTSIGGLRYQAFMGTIESAYGTYSAINELNDKLTKLETEKDGIDATILCLGIYKQMFEIQNNCIKIVNEFNNYKLSTMLKAVPSAELFGNIETKVKTSIARRNKLSSLMKTNEVVIGTLGLVISTLQLMQSLRSLAKNINQNDEHVIREDLANLINASAATLSSARTLATTLQGQAREKLKEKALENRAAKASADTLRGMKSASDVGEKLVTKSAVSGLEKLGVRAATALTIPYLGEVLLVIDVAMIAWSIYEEANKDNNYQKWVKLAKLN